jgi:hypothetical protein
MGPLQKNDPDECRLHFAGAFVSVVFAKKHAGQSRRAHNTREERHRSLSAVFTAVSFCGTCGTTEKTNSLKQPTIRIIS